MCLTTSIYSVQRPISLCVFFHRWFVQEDVEAYVISSYSSTMLQYLVRLCVNVQYFRVTIAADYLMVFINVYSKGHQPQNLNSVKFFNLQHKLFMIYSNSDIARDNNAQQLQYTATSHQTCVSLYIQAIFIIVPWL